MYCKQCGEKIIDGMRFCTECGAPVANPDVTKTLADLTQEARTQAPPQASVPQPVPPSQQQVQGAAPAMQPQGITNQPERKSNESPDRSPKKQGSALTVVALAIAAAALVVAIVGGFVLPSMNQPSISQNGDGPNVVQAGTATIAIKAGEQTGKTKILEENTPYIVVATTMGGNATFSDVMFNTSSGELYMTTKEKMDKDTERGVYWVAIEK